jgi:hypothetical protein
MRARGTLLIMPRSPWKPWPVHGSQKSTAQGRCYSCERYLGVPKVWRRFVPVRQAQDIAGVELEPGWYCPECLRRAKRIE